MQKMPNLNDVFLSIMASFIGFGLVIGIAQAAFDFGGGRSLLLSSPVFAESPDQTNAAGTPVGASSCPEGKVLILSPNFAPGTGHCVKREKLAPIKSEIKASTTANNRLLDPECMIAAVGARDGAILTALNAYNQTIISALNARTDGLKSAWQIATRIERKTAIRNTWSKFREATKQAIKILNEAKRQSWQKYNLDRKACGAYGAVDDQTSRYVDAML